MLFLLHGPPEGHQMSQKIVEHLIVDHQILEDNENLINLLFGACFNGQHMTF